MNQLVLAATKAEVDCLLPLGPAPGLPPSAVTATVYDYNGAELVAAASQTIAYWTTSGAIAAGATSFSVTSWGSHRVPRPGDTLLLAAASAPEQEPRERVVVERVDGTTVYVREDIELAHDDAIRVYATVQRVALTSTHTATKGRNCRVRLSVTLSGATATEAPQTAETPFDVVAQIPHRTLTEAAVKTRAPMLFNDLTGWASYSQGGWSAALDLAWERVLDDIWGRGLPADLLVVASQLEEATYWRLCLHAADESVVPSGRDVDTWTTRCKDEYDAALRRALGSIKWIDEDQDLVPDTTETSRRLVDTWLSM